MPLPAAHTAGNVGFGAGFRKREEARAETDAGVGTEHFTHKRGKRPAQIGHGHVLVHEQAFDLMEHRRVRDVRVAAVDASGRNHGDGRLLLEHGPHLKRGRMRTQHDAVGYVQGILHVARGVFRRNVQRFKAVVIRLHFRTGHDVVAKPLEDGADFFHHHGHRMQRTAPRQTAGQARVKACQCGGLFGVVESRLLGFELSCQAFLHPVGGLPQQRALRRLKFGKTRHDAGNAALASEEFNPERFHFLQRRSLIQTLFKFRDQAFKFREKVHLDNLTISLHFV